VSPSLYEEAEGLPPEVQNLD